MWPVLLGGALAIGLVRSRLVLPRIPEGDVLTVMERRIRPRAERLGMAMDAIEAKSREWAMGGVMFMALAILFAAIMIFSQP